MRLKHNEFDEIIAILALFRPGPLMSGMVDDFIERKHGRKPVEYPFEEVKDISKGNLRFGCIPEQSCSWPTSFWFYNGRSRHT
ncbi:MAG: hypothetical protein Q9M89_09875 [Persephonella sp.]|nr:hypothetical protein [Persephonella sp.]